MAFLDIIAGIGQFIFGAYWLSNGINHFTNLTALTGYAAFKKVPQPKLAVIGAGLLLILGGLGILLGLYTQIAILLLVIFLVPTTFMMHNFWTVSDAQARAMELIQFKKNLALLSALIMWAAVPMMLYTVMTLFK